MSKPVAYVGGKLKTADDGSALAIPVANLVGVLPVSKGGTGSTTGVQYGGLPDGIAVTFRYRNVTAGSTDIATPLAGNDVSNSFTGISSPDIPRTINVFFQANWTGGDITLHGTDSQGAFTETIVYVPFIGAYGVDTTRAFTTFTAAEKSAVGGTADTCSIRMGDYLGIPVGRPVGGPNGCVVVIVDDVLDPNPALGNIQNPVPGDPSFLPDTPPNDLRDYTYSTPLGN